jgi:hypothetical protein
MASGSQFVLTILSALLICGCKTAAPPEANGDPRFLNLASPYPVPKPSGQVYAVNITGQEVQLVLGRLKPEKNEFDPTQFIFIPTRTENISKFLAAIGMPGEIPLIFSYDWAPLDDKTPVEVKKFFEDFEESIRKEGLQVHLIKDFKALSVLILH